MKVRPKIEDVIPEILDKDMRETALEFSAWLRASKMAPGYAGVQYTWNASYKGKIIYRIQLKNDGWGNVKNRDHYWVVNPHLNHLDKYQDVITDEGLADFIYENLSYCIKCSPKCPGGTDITVLGRDFANVCHCRPLVWAYDPDESAITCIIRLLELEKAARLEM